MQGKKAIVRINPHRIPLSRMYLWYTKSAMSEISSDLQRAKGFCVHGNRPPCGVCKTESMPHHAAFEAIGVSIESPETDREAFIEQFDQSMLEAVKGIPDELAERLGTIDAGKVNARVAEFQSQLEGETDPRVRAELQIQLIDQIVTLISSVQGSGEKAFTPSLARELGEMDCTLSAWSLKEKLSAAKQDDVTFEFGYPADHAVGIVTIADGRRLYVDAQNGYIAQIELETVEDPDQPKTAYPISKISRSTRLTPPRRPNGSEYLPSYLGVRRDGALHTLGNMHMLVNRESPVFETEVADRFRASLEQKVERWNTFEDFVNEIAGGAVIQETVFGRREALRREIENNQNQELSIEKKKVLSQRLLEIASRMHECGVDFVIAGGCGLDLLDGDWSRDHQDFDVTIADIDREKFYDAARALGFLFTFPSPEGQRELTREEVLDPKEENVFLSRTQDDRAEEFEVMYLRGENADTTFAPRVIVQGVEVRLQPPETILYHKLLDGRRKDFEDTMRTWPNLNADQRERLERRFRDEGRRFQVGEDEAKNIDQLMDLAQARESQTQREFFLQALPGIEDRVEGDFRNNAAIIFETRQAHPLKETFFEALAQRYGGFMPERREILSRIADYLYQDSPPSQTVFQNWARDQVGMNEAIGKQASHAFLEQKLWSSTSAK